MPLGPPAFAVHEVSDGSAGLKHLDQAISRRHARTEFVGEAAKIAGSSAMLSASQEFPDYIGATPCDLPASLADLVWKWIRHQRSGLNI